MRFHFLELLHLPLPCFFFLQVFEREVCVTRPAPFGGVAAADSMGDDSNEVG